MDEVQVYQRLYDAFSLKHLVELFGLDVVLPTMLRLQCMAPRRAFAI